jgi:hypothetical protein
MLHQLRKVRYNRITISRLQKTNRQSETNRSKSVQIEGNPISIGVSTVFDVNLDRDESKTGTETRVRVRQDLEKT